MGTSFIAGATLEEALDVWFAYHRYRMVYKPVVASKLLGRDGNTYRVLLRIRESAAGLSAVLDVTARVQVPFPTRSSVFSVSTSEEIREVEDPGSPEERHLPAGRDSGYLWRAVTLNRIIEVDAGVLIEMETLGLSRGFPPLLHWFIEPIARRLGRKSVELSLQEFHSAVKAGAINGPLRTFRGPAGSPSRISPAIRCAPFAPETLNPSHERQGRCIQLRCYLP